MIKRFFVFAFSILLSQIVFAQSTIISGKVTDELTGEPMPFVAVVFKGSGVGVNTDFDGKYAIKTATPSDSILFNIVGYKRVAMRVKKGQTQVINVTMSVNKFELTEIVVNAGENPADAMMKKIIDHKDENNKRNLDSYQCEVYNKLEFDLTSISEKFKNSRVIKPFAFIFEKMDSSESNEKPFLPIFITENLSDYYFKNNPRKSQEIITASKISGVQNATVTQFLGDMYQNINVYNNFIDLFSKNFVSPVANISAVYYKYYLVDSAFIGNQWCYKMKFKPRRKQELTFVGDFWFHDTTYAVQKIQMRIADDANINFINDMAIVQEFNFVDNKYWMQSKDMLVIDFAAKQEGMGFIGRKTASYNKYKINSPIDEKIFTPAEEIRIKEGADEKDENFWNQARHDSLNAREKSIYALVDTIKAVPAFKTYVDLITLFVTGYKDFGKLEFGPYFTFASFNRTEGFRLRLGGRTSDEISTRLQLEGYVAYGFKDEDLKFGAGMRYIFKKDPRTLMGINYKDDISQLGQSDNAFQDDNILSSIFRRSPSNKLTKTIIKKVYFEREWFQGLANRITFTNQNLIPVPPLSYDYYPNGDNTQEPRQAINASEITLYTRFYYREKFVSGKVDRVSIGSIYPLVQANYTIGLKGVLNSDFTYHKANIKMSDQIFFKPFGYTYYIIEAGKVFGKLPYPLLQVHQGNESYFYDYAAFNLMNYYEFVSDAYASLSAVHHFNGFFLDRVPLLRKLKWRELASLRMVYGSLSAANRRLLVNPSAFSSLEKKPYMELGVGVENIFKILRVDFLWRQTYISKEYLAKYEQRFPLSTKPAQFGIRASLQITF
ncbi:MAG: carboxypeptidase-like regulatory domain-containing protein [Bacteroidetes bacterium]|nr:carboxypeptidase-like regulatory domain-containing protein [Bacteroidota bacterium]